jgi:hypothetical protein
MKETWMNRPILICALFALTAAALAAQEASQSSPYEGTSTPPSNDEVVTTVTVRSKPAPGHQVYVQSSNQGLSATASQPGFTVEPVDPAQQAAFQAQQAAPPVRQREEDVRPSSVDPSSNFPDSAEDYGTLPAAKSTPRLSSRIYAEDPDGDIVHPRSRRPGEIAEGTTIRVRLMHRLSTAYTEQGESFRTKVASDVVQGSQVLIPAGAEIDGRVVEVSRGHAGGHGTMRLRPETVILPDGTRYRLTAEITGTPGSKTHIGGEGTIIPDSRLKRDGIEYAGGVGGGAVAGALIGGPVGALTGSLVGAGFISVHLLVSHPQATLDSGTALMFTLTAPLYLTRADSNGE